MDDVARVIFCLYLCDRGEICILTYIFGCTILELYEDSGYHQILLDGKFSLLSKNLTAKMAEYMQKAPKVAGNGLVGYDGIAQLHFWGKEVKNMPKIIKWTF